MLVGRAKVNWSDFTLQLQTAGVDALPIVALLGFLTGLIMAYVGLIQLRQVGATVYVANLVSLAAGNWIRDAAGNDASLNFSSKLPGTMPRIRIP